jgi:hypothetical protein
MDTLTKSYFSGMADGIAKSAGPVQALEAAAPKAEGLAAKLVGMVRKNPIVSAATAAAAGAGIATGVSEAGEKKKEDERRRQQIRELLMQRLGGG